jgi:translation initiation factor 2 beta subunit (eIF-2beta)/eIF-5
MNNFNELLDEAYDKLDNNDNITLIVLPKIETEIGTTRLHWKNVNLFLETINRSPEHILIYLKHQMPDKNIDWFSGDKSNGIIIHGRFLKNNMLIELLKKYVNQYVICPCCKKSTSTMHKETSKNYEYKCLMCGFKKYLI